MRVVRSFLLLATLLLAGSPAFAQFQDQEDLRFVSAGPYGAVTAFGVYVGPYRAQVLPGMAYIDIYCVDFAHHALSTWRANFTPLYGNLAATRWGNGYRDQYYQSAWLASQFDPSGKGDWPALHAAIWQLFPPGDPAVNSTVAAGISELRSDWASASGSFDPGGWYVVTDVNGMGQEFLTYVTPEPETIFLLGTGLVAVFGMTIVMRRSLG